MQVEAGRVSTDEMRKVRRSESSDRREALFTDVPSVVDKRAGKREGFYMVPDSVAARTDLTPADKLFYAGLLRLANIFSTDHVFSSQLRFAEKLGISPDTQTRCVRRLVSADLLMITRKSLGRGKGSRLTFWIPAAAVASLRNRKMRPLRNEMLNEGR